MRGEVVEYSMKQIQWQKVPSVTTGGTPFFYNSITDDYAKRLSVVWDRFKEAWSVKGAQTLEHYRGKIYGYFKSVQEAKSFAETVVI